MRVILPQDRMAVPAEVEGVVQMVYGDPIPEAAAVAPMALMGMEPEQREEKGREAQHGRSENLTEHCMPEEELAGREADFIRATATITGHSMMLAERERAEAAVDQEQVAPIQAAEVAEPTEDGARRTGPLPVSQDKAVQAWYY